MIWVSPTSAEPTIFLFQGKPVAQARGEIAYGGSFIDWFAEEAKRTYGDIIPTHVAGRRLLVVKEACGVAALWVPVSMLFLNVWLR